MNKDIKKEKLIPELRFKEFKEEWENSKLAEVGKVVMCKRIFKNETRDVGEIPFFKIGTFGKIPDSYISHKTYTEYRSKYPYPKKGDILLSASGTIGRQVIFNGEPAYFQDSNIVWIDNNENIIKNSFLHYLYMRIRWVTDGSTIERLYNDNLRNIKINYPSLPEQQKISSFLSLIDKKIELLNKKKELLEIYKKGIMHNIFNRDIRFKDRNGNNYPEWEEKRLGEIVACKKSPLLARELNLNKGIYPVYGADGITAKIDTFQEEKDYISIVKDGAGVGRITFCPAKSSVVGTLDILQVNDLNDAYFIYLAISNLPLKSYIVGSTIPHIYFRDYKNEIIEIPKKEEQLKISHYIHDLNTNITFTDNQVAHVRLLKLGLLQKMFI